MVPDIDYSSVCGFCSLSILFSVINVGSLSVTGKDLIDIGERNGFLPGRVRKQLSTTLLVFFVSFSSSVTFWKYRSSIYLQGLLLLTS